MARTSLATALATAASLVALAAGCAVEEPVGPYAGHDEASDFEPVAGGEGKADGVAATFNRHQIVTDAFFEDTNDLDGDGIQAFLEATPYGDRRSFLADHTLADGRRLADALVEVAIAHRLHPVMLLARMQVEKSLVAKATAPSKDSIDFALGCGCPDGQACNEAYRGLDKQLTCAATTLRTHFDGSADATGQWRSGVARRTLDPISVTPLGHATASLYAYTPWVLTGEGGNWLVWNVTRRYMVAIEEAGLILAED